MLPFWSFDWRGSGLEGIAFARTTSQPDILFSSFIYSVLHISAILLNVLEFWFYEQAASYPHIEEMLEGIILTSPALRVRPAHPIVGVSY